MKNENGLEQKVKKIINEVRISGDAALVKYTRLFDGIKSYSKKDISVIIRPVNLKDKNFIKAINIAIRNVRKFHRKEYFNIKKLWMTEYNSIVAGQKFVPVESVGVYIPGGKYGYNYVSTLIMTVIPAQVAGVKKIVVVTPPKNVTDYFLYTAYKLGIKQVFKIGGVQAIAALAFGTKIVPKVDLIVGPGNIWVTEAKRQLVGQVGIDLLAGPSEVVVVGDKKYRIEEIVYELLAQAEHDKNAKSYFIGLDYEIVQKVKEYLRKNAADLLPQIKIIYEKKIDRICKIVNQISPEHLTLLTEKQDIIIKGIKNAGAIFYGKHPSAVFGDYIAGPSHVLPTDTTARFYSGLSVTNFLKKISIVKFTKNAVKNFSKYTSVLAEIEGMQWHKKRVDLYNMRG